MRADLEVVQVAQPLVERRHNLNVQQVPRKLPSLQLQVKLKFKTLAQHIACLPVTVRGDRHVTAHELHLNS